MSTSLVQVRVDDDIKNQAAAICEDLGIDLPTAVRMFLKRTVLQNGIPFSMTLPNREYQATRAVRAMQQLSDEAQKNGTAGMTLEEINEEISSVRREHEATSEAGA